MNIDPEFVVSSHAQLRDIVGPVDEHIAAKSIDHIDQYCATFIDHAPFVLIASRAGDALLDISPKSDAPGFVSVLNENWLAILDRPGNARHDTYENIFADNAVALLFLIPGRNDTLRIAGRATLTEDPKPAEQFAIRGRVPTFVLLIEVHEAFMHCTKCGIRSGLWRPEAWPDTAAVPSLAEAYMADARISMPIDEMEAELRRDEKEELY
ncbi:MAG: MSMEG_1061 family FMN-dependent PPOX-type flavoprotein [Pseudomonadota bacterium]